MELTEAINEAAATIRGVIPVTPLMENKRLSTQLNASVWLKREDLQEVRSYKIRGAYYKMSCLTAEQRAGGIVCASAGNHAQGVAYSCAKMGIHGTIFMPETTPKQKVQRVRLFGESFIEIQLIGDTFDAANAAAQAFCSNNRKTFIHPFDDPQIIAGQGTVALEIIRQIPVKPDMIVVPVGGGGLAAGTITVLKQFHPEAHIIGVEPAGAPSMKQALKAGQVMRLETIDKFVDGAAVQQVGEHTFDICKNGLDAMLTVPEGKVCETILRLYNEEAMVVEPAGALSIAACELYPELFAGKNVVCIVSGSNNDILRTPEIQERALLYSGLKHYFLIEFPQRPGSLKSFVTEVLGEQDDITYFQFSKKNNREYGPAVVGVELRQPEALFPLKERLGDQGFSYEYLNDNFALYSQLIG